jgi:hemerythrin-like domain-containing protein
MPIGPLMIEHRLIEKMIGLMSKELERMRRDNTARPSLIYTMVDFIRFYADRCHHGKEEDILFRELKKRKLKPEHETTMNELIEEHKWGRKTTKRLVDATRSYENGDEAALAEIAGHLKELASFYPKHIEKEDKRFFKPVMEYFTQEERDAMLDEGFEFDQSLIHDKYRSIVSETQSLFD